MVLRFVHGCALRAWPGKFTGSQEKQATVGVVIKLICIDVDGTLIGSSGELENGILEKAEGLRAKGIRISICTGRPGFGKTYGWAKALDPQGWHIFQSGASILGDSTSLSTPLPIEAVEMLSEEKINRGWVLEWYSDQDWTVDSEHTFAVDHARLLGLRYEKKSLFELQGTPIRAQWIVPHEDVQTVLANPIDGLECHTATSPVMPDASFISMTARGVSKASAIQTVAERLGIDLSEVMMVGDAPNDISAFAVVGHSVAMGNADRYTKSRANHGVSHVDSGGLLEAFSLAEQI